MAYSTVSHSKALHNYSVCMSYDIVIAISPLSWLQRTFGKSQRQLWREKLLLVFKTFSRPSLIILFVAGSIRNAGGYVWAYNTQPYFNKYYPDVNVGKYMSWIPLVGGSFGVVLGGFISDRLVKNRGSYARVWVLVFSQVESKSQYTVNSY